MGEQLDRQFIVVLQAAGACRFAERDLLSFRYQTPSGLVALVFTTRYADEGLESKVPRELTCLVAVDAPDIYVAAEAAARHANMTAAVIAATVNATVQDFQPVIVYERRPVDGRREFFQSHFQQEVGLPRRTRVVAPPPVLAVLGALTSSDEAERLHRAASHYNRALMSWRSGAETSVVTPLWMAVEALTEVALRAELRRLGIDERGLASSWSIGTDGPDRDWRTKLSAEVRLRLIFASDETTYRRAKKASDGWEHGFLSFDHVRELAVASRDRTATLVRTAFLRLAGVDDPTSAGLLAPPYSTPREFFPYARYVKGWLEGEGDDPAAPDDAYPSLIWSYRLSKFKGVPGGGYEIGFEDKMTPRIGGAIGFRADRIEVWGPRGEES